MSKVCFVALGAMLFCGCVGAAEEPIFEVWEEEVLMGGLAVALDGLGKYEQALIHFQRALEILPNYAEAHYNLANLLIKQKRSDEALEHYSEAII